MFIRVHPWQNKSLDSKQPTSSKRQRAIAYRAVAGMLEDIPSSRTAFAMTQQQRITDKLEQHFQPVHLEVVNESHMHNVPPGSESHFKVTVVSEAFAGQKLVARHRMVNKVLSDELAGGIHALALHTLDPEQWFERAGKVPDSPPCLGGGKT